MPQQMSQRSIPPMQEEPTMATVTVGTENGTPVELHYETRAAGGPSS